VANRSVSLYLRLKIKNKWSFSKVAEEPSKLTTGEYYLSWYEGSRKHLDPVGNDPKTAQAKLEKKRLELAFVAVGGEVKTSNLPKTGNGTRKMVSSAIRSTWKTATTARASPVTA
jgi:hypothetical protein